MFARAVTWKVVPGELDRLLAMAANIMPSLQQQHGFQGVYAYVNRTEKTMLTISHWASIEDLEADEKHHAQSVKALASLATVIQEERCEVVYR